MTKINRVIIMFCCILEAQCIKKSPVAIILKFILIIIRNKFWVPNLTLFKCL